MNKKKKRLLIFGAIFATTLSLSFNIGIFNNPNFSLTDFFLGLSIEFIGWIIGVSLFQPYSELRIAMANESERKSKSTTIQSVADEISKLKTLQEENIITEKEFETAKTSLLSSIQAIATDNKKPSLS